MSPCALRGFRCHMVATASVAAVIALGWLTLKMQINSCFHTDTHTRTRRTYEHMLADKPAVAYLLPSQAASARCRRRRTDLQLC